MVGIDLQTNERSVLLELDTPSSALLVLAPDGATLAVLRSKRVELGGGGDGELPDEIWGSELALVAAPSSAELLSGDGGGRVVWRLDGGKTVPICAWFSPDSRKLLCYDAPFDPLTSDLEDLERGSESVCATVWELPAHPSEGEPARRTFNPWRPSSAFLSSVVPFFDQYAQAGAPPHALTAVARFIAAAAARSRRPPVLTLTSRLRAQAVTPWSPDSASFCFASSDGTVHVQKLDEPVPGPGGTPAAPDAKVLLPDDEIGTDLVYWSPC